MLYHYYNYVRLLVAKMMDTIVNGFGASPVREESTSSALVVHNAPAPRVWNIYNDIFLFFGNQAANVHSRLWVGSAINAADQYFIQSIPIVGVVNVTPEVPNFYNSTVSYCNIAIRDDQDCCITHELYEQAARFIDGLLEQHPVGHVLVHCFVGRSRSVAVCCYWMMTRHSYRFRDCYAHITAKRPYARINEQFARTLRSLEDKSGG
jgi:hypothetical protein